MSKNIEKRRGSLFPTTLGKCVEQITRPALKTRGLAGMRIISEWQSIVGGQLASHCLPHKLSFPIGKKTDGTLTIAVENGFAPALQHSQTIILEKLAIYFGYRAISKITIAHSYTKEVEKSLKKPIEQKLSTSDLDVVRQVEDEELRKALENIAKNLIAPSNQQSNHQSQKR